MKLQSKHLLQLGEFYGNQINALYESEYILNKESNTISFLFKTSKETFYVDKTFEEVSKSIVENILTKKEIQKVGNLIGLEVKASYMYNENTDFIFTKNSRKLKVTKTYTEILNLLFDNKDMEIEPKITARKSTKHNDAFMIGGTLERRKCHYFLKNYTEKDDLYEVPTLFYAEGVKKWYETTSYFDKEEFNLILKKIKVC